MSEENHVIKLRVNTALLAKAVRWVAPAADTREKYFTWVNNVRFELQRSDENKSVGHFDAANNWERMQVKSDYVLTLVATDRVLMSWATVPVEVVGVRHAAVSSSEFKPIPVDKTDLSVIWSIHADKLFTDMKLMQHVSNARHVIEECKECVTDFINMKIEILEGDRISAIWWNKRHKASAWAGPVSNSNPIGLTYEFPWNWGTMAAHFGMGVQTDHELPRVLAFNPDYLATLASAYRASCGATSAPLKFRIEGSSPHSSKTPVAIAASDERVMRSAVLMSMKLKEGDNSNG